MDPIDGFYQALDSEQLLKEHGPSLVAEAREMLQQHSHAKLGGPPTPPPALAAVGTHVFLTQP